MSNDEQPTKYLSLYEAWELIPAYTGKNLSHTDDFINAMMYVADRVDPANKSELLNSILKSKIQGLAVNIMDLEKIETFDQLKDELAVFNRTRKSIDAIKYEWKACRQKRNESVAEFSLRFNRLMKELINAFTRVTKSERARRNTQKFIRQLALNYYINSLCPNYKKTKERGYTDLPDAIMRALNEEKMEKNPELANIECAWCGDKGHDFDNCYVRSRHEKRLRSRAAASC